ncbi:ABC transporter permease [Nitratireductor indicus]|uniref:ABC transporter permease n=1 Tax=Nitratireductor indicus TaxID=721133 RepID=UPI002876CD97|nr:ABC transporter permease [Nitratireductor indicus]MDS1138571.1 ABC transporter permease [Nitratireductor indicus]
MSALLGLLLNKYVMGAGAALVGLALAVFKAYRAGASKERQKQTQERLKARQVADEIDNDVGAMSSEESRKELSKWAR